MIKRKSKIYVLGLTAVLLGCCLWCLLASPAAAELDFQLQSELPSNAMKGDTVIVPEAKFGGIDADRLTYAPDGTVYTGSELYLRNQGTYTIKYTAAVDGRLVARSESFTAGNPAYYFGDGRSSATYGYNETAERTGLNVTLARNDTFRYNRVVDLKALAAGEPVVTFTTTSTRPGWNDCDTLYVTLTDAYDPNNRVEVYFGIGNGSEPSYWHYSRARANGQAWKAWDNSGAEAVLRINTYGTVFSYTAAPSWKDASVDIPNVNAVKYLGVIFNPKTNEVSHTYYHFGMGDNRSPIIDLDDANIQEEIFAGFTTGEVYVDIRGENYSADFLNLTVTKIGQYADDDLSAIMVNDRTPPIVTVDTLGYEIVPDGAAGKSYPVFEASARDVNSGGYVPVTTRVFYQYTRRSGAYYDDNARYSREIHIRDGRFDTDVAGYYAICYRAFDFDGNFVEKVVGVNVTRQSTALAGPGLSEGYATATEAGNRVKVAAIDLSAVSGGASPYKLTYEVMSGGERAQVTGNDVIGYSFTPTAAGDYQVTARVTDLLGDALIRSYTVRVTPQTGALFVSDARLPKYLFAAADYVLPPLYGTDATGRPVTASVSIKDGGGTREYAAGEKTRFTADARGNATIRYYSGAVSREYVIPVISVFDGADIDLTRYIVSAENVTAGLDPTGLKLTATGDGSAEFARNLVADGLRLRLSLLHLGTDMDEFAVKLTDSADPSDAVALRFVADGSEIDVYVNDRLVSDGFFTGYGETRALDIAYDGGARVLRVGGSLAAAVTDTVYGARFDGFLSGEAYVSFAMRGVRGSASAYLTHINTQQLKAGVTSDLVAPATSVIGDYGTLYRAAGSEAEVLPAIACDVLSPYTQLHITVMYEGAVIHTFDNDSLRAVGGSFTLEKTGVYTIRYRAVDWNNRGSNATYNITSVDTVPPVITVEEIPASAEIGEIVLPEITVTDNTGAQPTLYVTVRRPDGILIYAQNNRFAADIAGDYTVTVTAMDGAGNYASRQAVISVR